MQMAISLLDSIHRHMHEHVATTMDHQEGHGAELHASQQKTFLQYDSNKPDGYILIKLIQCEGYGFRFHHK